MDGVVVLGCAADRATLWGVGNLISGQGHRYAIPLPVSMSGKAQFHELVTTVAWFTPPRIGHTQYRGVRLKLLRTRGAWIVRDDFLKSAAGHKSGAQGHRYSSALDRGEGRRDRRRRQP